MLMLNNDNMMKDSCSAAELQRILSGCGNRPAANLDLPTCESEQGKWGLAGYPLASVYAPIQEFDKLYDLDKGFVAGTIFSELDLPFMGRSLKYNKSTGGCYDK